MRTNYNGSNQNDFNFDSEDFINKTIDENITEENTQEDFAQEEYNLEKVLGEVPDTPYNPYRENLVQAFLDIDSSIMVSKQEENSLENEPAPDYGESSPYVGVVDNNENTPQETTENKEESPKKKSKKKLVIIISSIVGGILLIVALLFALGVFKFDNVDTSTLKGIKTKMNMMYNDDLKNDIKDGYSESDVDSLLMDLKKIPESDDTDKVEDELKSIQHFMTDKVNVNKYVDDNYDLRKANELAIIQCNDFVNNSNRYTVAGLNDTIKSLANSVIEDWNNYQTADDLLSSVSNVSSFDSDSANKAIAKVNHTPLRDSLTSKYEKLLADKNTALAKNKLKKAKDAKEKKKAEEDLKKSQEEQKNLLNKLSELESKVNKTDATTTTVKVETTVPMSTPVVPSSVLEGENIG